MTWKKELKIKKYIYIYIYSVTHCKYVILIIIHIVSRHFYCFMFLNILSFSLKLIFRLLFFVTFNYFFAICLLAFFPYFWRELNLFAQVSKVYKCVKCVWMQHMKNWSWFRFWMVKPSSFVPFALLTLWKLSKLAYCFQKHMEKVMSNLTGNEEWRKKGNSWLN